MINRAETGSTYYLKLRGYRPVWEKSLEPFDALYLGRGWFPFTPDASGLEDYPLILELNPEINEKYLKDTIRIYEGEGCIARITKEPRYRPFSEEYVSALLVILANKVIPEEVQRIQAEESDVL